MTHLEDQRDSNFPVNHSLQGFGRGLFVSTNEVDAHTGGTDPSFIENAIYNARETSPNGSTRDSRSQSITRFVEEGDLANKLAMQKELDRMVTSMKNTNLDRSPFFQMEIDGFKDLFDRYLDQKKRPPLDWEKVQNLDSDTVTPTIFPGWTSSMYYI